MAPKQSFVDLAAIAQAIWTDTNLTENSKLFAKKSERADLLIGNLEHANYNFSPQEAETFLAIFQGLVKADFNQVRELVAAPRAPRPDRVGGEHASDQHASDHQSGLGAESGFNTGVSATTNELEAAAAAGRSDQVNEIFHRLAQTNTYLPNSAIARAMRIAKDNLHNHTSLLLGCYRNAPAGRLAALEQAAKYSYWDLVLGFSHTVPIQTLTKVYNLANSSGHQGAIEVVRILTAAGFMPANPPTQVRSGQANQNDQVEISRAAARLAKNAAKKAARREREYEKYRSLGNAQETNTAPASGLVSGQPQQLAYINRPVA